MHHHSSRAACKAYWFILPLSVIKSRHSHVTPVLCSHFLPLPSLIAMRARAIHIPKCHDLPFTFQLCSNHFLTHVHTLHLHPPTPNSYSSNHTPPLLCKHNLNPKTLIRTTQATSSLLRPGAIHKTQRSWIRPSKVTTICTGYAVTKT
jgi:hypothetical protein